MKRARSAAGRIAVGLAWYVALWAGVVVLLVAGSNLIALVIGP